MKKARTALNNYLIVFAMALVVFSAARAATAYGSEEIVPPIAPSPLTVHTDRPAYVGNQTITISGMTLDESEKTILVEIFNPQNNLIRKYDAAVSPDGSFRLQINGNLGVTGIYRVMSTLHNGYNFDRPFMFIAGPYHVMVGTSDYPVSYNLTAGALLNVKTNAAANSIDLDLANVTSSTDFVFIMAKELMGVALQKNYTGLNVLMGKDQSLMRQVNFTQAENNTGMTTLKMEIPYEGVNNPLGTWHVRIIGTSSVPEFGSLASMIVTISIIGVILISRKSF